ncbi:MAG: hypothetical protein ACC628_12775 [Pirellulaceae bacterium]
MVKKKSPETFELRFVGPEIRPEEIPLRAVGDALSAVQDIASGRDPFEVQQVPPEKSIGLTKVRRGSAVYACVARDPSEAIANLGRVGDLLSAPDDASFDERLIPALRPIESLSDVAKSLHCRLEVRRTGDTKNGHLLAVEANDYTRISRRVFFQGETTIIGSVMRAGGVTGMRCVMRIEDRRRALYCDVASRELVRRLGQCLYQQIAAVGTAVWIHSSWRVHKFEISDFTQPRLGNVEEVITDLRNSGLGAWDNIDDPESYIQELR